MLKNLTDCGLLRSKSVGPLTIDATISMCDIDYGAPPLGGSRTEFNISNMDQPRHFKGHFNREYSFKHSRILINLGHFHYFYVKPHKF